MAEESAVLDDKEAVVPVWARWALLASTAMATLLILFGTKLFVEAEGASAALGAVLAFFGVVIATYVPLGHHMQWTHWQRKD